MKNLHTSLCTHCKHNIYDRSVYIKDLLDLTYFLLYLRQVQSESELDVFSSTVIPNYNTCTMLKK